MLKSLWRRLNPALKPAQPDKSFPLDATSFTVLDTETTGLNFQTDEILAIGAIRMLGSRILVGETFYRLIRPTQTTWERTAPIHRILPADVSAAPPFETVAAELSLFCGQSVLVGHTVKIDRAFLTQPRGANIFTPQSHVWLDVGKVARWLARKQFAPQDSSLSTLARHYRIAVSVRHHALADAFVTAQIWQRQLFQLKQRRITHLSDLQKAGLI